MNESAGQNSGFSSGIFSNPLFFRSKEGLNVGVKKLSSLLTVQSRIITIVNNPTLFAIKKHERIVFIKLQGFEQIVDKLCRKFVQSFESFYLTFYDF